ncbi:MAG: TIGR01777 family protein [SAR202 cluster bacterium]|nr:TIGR01777 family protein [SAR202 cluster bacterium]|tara:strand:+ start:2220 stop:3167 length:948 start_codon:yes stop_codon:yes gene_type:complete
MKILVTGATGFIGRQLIKSLVDAGHSTSILTRRGVHQDLDDLKRTLRVNHVFDWDPTARPSRIPGIENTDAIIHLAGEPVIGLWTSRKRVSISESRILGTNHLIETLEASNTAPQVFISASAVGYYGDRGQETLTEESSKGFGYLTDVCEGWEQAARGAERLGARVTTLRLGLVFGSTGGSLVPLIKVTNLGLGGALGSGAQWWPWIHIDDVLNCIGHLLNEPFEGPLNLVSREPLQQRELMARLGKIMGRPSFMPVPRFILTSLLGEMATEFLNSRRVTSVRMEKANYDLQFPFFNEAIYDILQKKPSSPIAVS